MNGIFLLDKPQKMTSFDCCTVMRKALGTKKTGHAGTLDPMATGVLPILVGNATRAMDLLPVRDKKYVASLRFGLISDTLDIWGSVTETGKLEPPLKEIKAAVPAFRGNIWQRPPMMSALKQNGVRLYDLARKGVEVERQPRPVTVYSLEILDYRSGELTLECHCSKGTYIRSLCDDLGRTLGCGAVMTALRRTMAAGYELEQCVPVARAREMGRDELEKLVLPTESIFMAYPAVAVTPAQAARFQNGGSLSLDRLSDAVTGTVRVRGPEGFIGLAEPVGEELKLVKLFL